MQVGQRLQVDGRNDGGVGRGPDRKLVGNCHECCFTGSTSNVPGSCHTAIRKQPITHERQTIAVVHAKNVRS